MLSEFAGRIRATILRLNEALPESLPARQAAETAAYRALSKEMLEGLEIWIPKVMKAKSDFIQFHRGLDDAVRTEQVALVRSIEACLGEDLSSFAQLQYALREAVEAFLDFSRELKGQISLTVNRIPKLSTNRTFRYINFCATKSRDDFSRLLRKGDQLATQLGETQADEALEMVGHLEEEKSEFLELLFAPKEGGEMRALFSDEEQDLLRQWLDEG